ncbi:hypothetical protein CC86DRAFT_20899 [Ophiobolus disseminans]|uniref:Uncharacterized protein n=1 Tax=Ophiobolus disseminans TaxID=1469910 RepID=A0A6A7A1X5_9PLEO|nr:hypothetical protein CC86DRAFT_20899 [Ophiobolus disseminans]
MPFLALPAELRDEVYKHAISLKSEPFASYEGLLLSCRQVKNEMEQEGTRLMHSHLAHLEQHIPQEHGLHSKTASTFRDLRHLRLSLSKSLDKRHDPKPDTMQYLQPILDLYLESLTLSYHEADGKHFSINNIHWLACNILGNAMCPGGTLNTQRLIFDLPAMTKHQAQCWLSWQKRFDALSKPEWWGQTGSFSLARGLCWYTIAV